MEELRAALGLGAVTLVAISLVVYFGLKLNKAVNRQAKESDTAVIGYRLTLAGAASFACVVGFWVICLVAGRLRPESSLGAFVRTADGVIAVILASIFFVVIAEAILEKLGYPIAKSGDHS